MPVKSKKSKPPKIDKFDLEPGRKIAGIYEVEEFLGGGYEGEVYKVVESRTGISRTAKLFFPHRNERDREARTFAKKLEKLRDCAIVIQYHHAETLRIRSQAVTCLISEYVEGVQLSQYIREHHGKRLPPFKALHLFYALMSGLDEIHWRNEYHGDLHSENILVKPRGIFFDLKLVDFYFRGRPNKEHRQGDIIEAMHVLYEAIGGRRYYATMPPEIKSICLGLRRDLILKTYPSARHVLAHLETFDWS
jgi:serine/threonine protein kinase